nr:ATP synthase F0 subunit 6 [Pseudocapillaria tomentosa]
MFMCLMFLLYNSFNLDYSHMMYPHMELSGMMWNSYSMLNSSMSLIYFMMLLVLIPKISFFNSRWDWIMNKFMYLKYLNNLNVYTLISMMSILVFLINFYSLFSFNWVPFSQSWLILIMTTMYLLSIWMYMIFSGGFKLFGEKIPLSWMMLNFMLWFFHNLSFFIRFISLPFRMMMNLIVGMFLVDFSKSLLFLTSFISVYEVFVMLIQTLVFIILANMYYTEMIILPEWKSHKTNYNFNMNMKVKPLFKVIKNFFILKMINNKLF